MSAPFAGPGLPVCGAEPPSKALGSEGVSPSPGGLAPPAVGALDARTSGQPGGPGGGTKNVLICFFLQDLAPPKSCPTELGQHPQLCLGTEAIAGLQKERHQLSCGFPGRESTLRAYGRLCGEPAESYPIPCCHQPRPCVKTPGGAPRGQPGDRAVGGGLGLFSSGVRVCWDVREVENPVDDPTGPPVLVPPENQVSEPHPASPALCTPPPPGPSGAQG